MQELQIFTVVFLSTLPLISMDNLDHNRPAPEWHEKVDWRAHPTVSPRDNTNTRQKQKHWRKKLGWYYDRFQIEKLGYRQSQLFHVPFPPTWKILRPPFYPASHNQHHHIFYDRDGHARILARLKTVPGPAYYQSYYERIVEDPFSQQYPRGKFTEDEKRDHRFPHHYPDPDEWYAGNDWVNAANRKVNNWRRYCYVYYWLCPVLPKIVYPGSYRQDDRPLRYGGTFNYTAKPATEADAFWFLKTRKRVTTRNPRTSTTSQQPSVQRKSEEAGALGNDF